MDGSDIYFGTGLDRDVLTTNQVADWLQVHRSTVSRIANNGEIPSHKIGRCLRFKRSDVLEFFENQVDRECVSDEEEE